MTTVQPRTIPSKFKVFLSADIVGSTAYKQPFEMGDRDRLDSNISNSLEWQKTIQDFYKDLIEDFPRQWDKNAESTGDMHSEVFGILAGDGEQRPHFWKTIGDEVIFWKEITSEHQLWVLLVSWLESITQLRVKLHKLNLDVKSTVWSAEFPVRNRVLYNRFLSTNDTLDPDDEELRRGKADDHEDGLRIAYSEQILRFYQEPDKVYRSFDFIGPGIDVGFRISGFSTLKKMAISVDVAYLLALSFMRLDKDTAFRQRTGIDGHGLSNKLIGEMKDALAGLRRPLALDFDDPTKSAFEDRVRIMDAKMFFDGWERIKGALGGIEYPKLWIDTAPANSFEKKKETISPDAHRQAVEWKDLYDFCVAFYHDRRKFIHAPVILSSDELTATISADLTEQYRAALSIYNEKITDIMC